MVNLIKQVSEWKLRFYKNCMKVYNLIELKTICSTCARKATMVVRLDSKGNVVTEGSKIKIGGNDIYKVVCRKHFRKLTQLI